MKTQSNSDVALLPPLSGSRLPETPRTDAAEKDGYYYGMNDLRAKVIPSDLARDLERNAHVSIERLWSAMPPDVQRKISCHDLKRICDNLNSENSESSGR